MYRPGVCGKSCAAAAGLSGHSPPPPSGPAIGMFVAQTLGDRLGGVQNLPPRRSCPGLRDSTAYERHDRRRRRGDRQKPADWLHPHAASLRMGPARAERMSRLRDKPIKNCEYQSADQPGKHNI